MTSSTWAEYYNEKAETVDEHAEAEAPQDPGRPLEQGQRPDADAAP